MPGTLTMLLQPAGTEVCPKWLHAAGCALVEAPDADHHAEVKPFSVGPVTLDPRGTATWRIGWLHDRQPAQPKPSLRIGPTVWPVLETHAHPVSYQQLATSTPARAAELEFTSPLYFSRNGRDYPMPDPQLVLTSLIRKWNTYSPILIDDELRRALLNGIYLDEFDGRTVLTNVTLRQQQTGFVGTVRLALLRQSDRETCTAFAALMRYTEHAGVGAQPTHGYGAVNLLRLVPAPQASVQHAAETHKNALVLARTSPQVKPHDRNQTTRHLDLHPPADTRPSQPPQSPQVSAPENRLP